MPSSGNDHGPARTIGMTALLGGQTPSLRSVTIMKQSLVMDNIWEERPSRIALRNVFGGLFLLLWLMHDLGNQCDDDANQTPGQALQHIEHALGISSSKTSTPAGEDVSDAVSKDLEG